MSFVSMPIVMVFYMLTNAAYFVVLSYQQILDTKAVGLVSVYSHTLDGLVILILLGIWECCIGEGWTGDLQPDRCCPYLWMCSFC